MLRLLLQYIQNQFKDKLIDDDREPIYVYHFDQDTSFVLLAPKWEFYHQLILVLLLQISFQCSMAILIYICIIKRRRIHHPSSKTKKHDDDTKNYTMMSSGISNNYSNPIESYLLGWGCIIPIAFYVPYVMIFVLNVQNTSIRMSTATSAIIVAYRCIEAIYNTSPHTVEYNIFSYMTYYSTLLHFQWDPITHQRRSITLREFIVNATYFFITWVLLSITFSYAMYYNFRPFASPISDIQNFHFNSDIFHLGHIANMYLLAFLTYLTLSFGMEITSIGEQVKGYYTVPIFHNPMFTSRSPSDFWNRKWNTMIHTILKYGTFYPAQQFTSKRMALFVTFLMSGFIHEYNLSLMFYRHPDDSIEPLFVPKFFKLTAFFAWNGIVILLERPLAPYIQPMTSKLPTLMVSTLVVLSALPVSHWFTGDWVVGNFFHNLSIGLWVIRKV